MMQTVKGIYRDGKVELLELPGDVAEGEVLVTFVRSAAKATDTDLASVEKTSFEAEKDLPGRHEQVGEMEPVSGRLYRKKGVLVLNTGEMEDIDLNACIKDMREERSQDLIRKSGL